MDSPSPSPQTTAPTTDHVVALFGYTPILGLAAAAAAVFGLLAVAQLWLYWKNRPNGYMLVLFWTALIGECIGYVIRIVAMQHPSTGIYILTTLLILLSPCAMALVNYIVCGRILAFTGMNVGCLRPHWIARVFLSSDVVTFLVQGFGGALFLSTNANTIKAGQDIVTAGLAIQIGSFSLFLYTALCIQWMRRYGFRESATANKAFLAMHATTFLLIVRSIYRLLEFNMGHDGYVATHEWTFYVFDTCTMALAFVIYSWPSLHFGKCINDLARERAEQLPTTNVDTSDVLARVELPEMTKGAIVLTVPPVYTS